MDKKNIRSVIHVDLPLDVESFLQESGRAGRDGNPAQSIILVGEEESRRGQEYELMHPFNQLLRVCQQTSQCRREALLELMGFHHTSCSGCDICNQSSVALPDGQLQILSVIRWYPLRFTSSEAASLLTGSHSRILCPPITRGNPFFGVLENWEMEDVIEAITRLQGEGVIKTSRYLPRPEVLYPPLTSLFKPPGVLPGVLSRSNG